MEFDPILTAKEIAVELRCSKGHVVNIMRGKVKNVAPLPHLPLGRKLVVRRSTFEAWKKANETGDIVAAGSETKTASAVH